MSVRLVAVTMIALASLCGAAVCMAGPSPSPVWLPNCGNSLEGGAAAPASWDDGCTEQTDLVRAHWRNWVRATATAQGFTQYSPDVVRFRIVVYPVRVVAWRIRRCSDGHKFHWYYTRVRLTFTLRHPDYLFPSGHAVQTDALFCSGG